MKNYPKSIKSFDEINKEFVYVLTSLEGIAESFDEKIERELNRKFVLELVGTFEAKTVYYYRNIVKKRTIMNDGNIPETIRKAIKNHQRHLMLNHIESIFLYTVQPLDNKSYSEYVHLVSYRNWLAHGRGWDYENRWNRFDFQTTLLTIRSLISLINDYPDELKN